MMVPLDGVKIWDRNEFPAQEDFSKIISNVAKIKNMYPFIKIDIPPNILRWDYANDIERILFEVKNIWDGAITWDCADQTDVFFDWDDFESKVPNWNHFETYIWCRHMNWNEFDAASRTWDIIDEEGFFIAEHERNAAGA